jgi:predicted RNase H-like HicB family nuclease
LPEKWLATLAERESKPNISADGATLEEAVINLKEAVGKK